jgi:hypothetical protein
LHREPISTGSICPQLCSTYSVGRQSADSGVVRGAADRRDRRGARAARAP